MARKPVDQGVVREFATQYRYAAGDDAKYAAFKRDVAAAKLPPAVVKGIVSEVGHTRWSPKSAAAAHDYLDRRHLEAKDRARRVAMDAEGVARREAAARSVKFGSPASTLAVWDQKALADGLADRGKTSLRNLNMRELRDLGKDLKGIVEPSMRSEIAREVRAERTFQRAQGDLFAPRKIAAAPAIASPTRALSVVTPRVGGRIGVIAAAVGAVAKAAPAVGGALQAYVNRRGGSVQGTAKQIAAWSRRKAS